LAVAGKDSVWALLVGGDAPSLFHYDGANWQASPVPAPPGLFRIWAKGSDEVYGLSQDSAAAMSGTHIHLFDGNAWSEQTQSADVLYALQGTGSVVYAVGLSKGSSGSSAGVVWKNAGGKWRRIAGAELGAGLLDLTCTMDGTCIAVGGGAILALDPLH
jgi:hypothetical protein